MMPYDSILHGEVYKPKTWVPKKTPAAWHFEWVIHLYITLGIQLIQVSGLGYRYQTYGHFRFFVAIYGFGFRVGFEMYIKHPTF